MALILIVVGYVVLSTLFLIGLCLSAARGDQWRRTAARNQARRELRRPSFVIRPLRSK